jgi:hypothetical protein
MIRTPPGQYRHTLEPFGSLTLSIGEILARVNDLAGNGAGGNRGRRG